MFLRRFRHPYLSLLPVKDRAYPEAGHGVGLYHFSATPPPPYTFLPKRFHKHWLQEDKPSIDRFESISLVKGVSQRPPYKNHNYVVTTQLMVASMLVGYIADRRHKALPIHTEPPFVSPVAKRAWNIGEWSWGGGHVNPSRDDAKSVYDTGKHYFQTGLSIAEEIADRNEIAIGLVAEKLLIQTEMTRNEIGEIIQSTSRSIT